MSRQKTALNRLEALIHTKGLSAEALKRIPGAGSLAKRMGALAPGVTRDSAQTRLLRKIRNDSVLDTRPLTDRQLRIEALSGQVLAKANGAKPRSMPMQGIMYPRRGAAIKTPIGEAAAKIRKENPGLVPYARGGVDVNNPVRGIYYDPSQADYSVHAVNLRGRRKPRSLVRTTVLHEVGEKKTLENAVRLNKTLSETPTAEQQNAIQRRYGAIPLGGHIGPEPLLRQYSSHAGMGWGGRTQGTSMADWDTWTVQPLTPSEKALKKIMKQVYATPTGDFPLGGRHEQAVRARLVKELLAHPKKYDQDLRNAFGYGVANVRLHPDLESFLVQNARKYY